MVRKLSIVLLFSLLIISCTTINMTEKEAFNIKRTISPAFFENKPYEFEEVQLVSGDSLKLKGWLIKSHSATGTVVYYGGNGFVMVISYNIIKSIIDQNMNLLVFDYRG